MLYTRSTLVHFLFLICMVVFYSPNARSAILGMPFTDASLNLGEFEPAGNSSGHVPNLQGALSYDTLGYIYDTQSRNQSVFPSVSLGGNAQTQGRIFEATVQGGAWMMVVPSHPVFAEVSELNVGTSKSLAPVQVSLGRKLEHWSELDETWKLGIIQPRFRRDFIHPDSVGLTGAFVNYEQNGIKAVAYGSPVFLPERGMPIEERDGKLVSSSQWMVPPPSEIQVLAQNTPVRYTLDIPAMHDVILHPNAGALLRVGEDQGFWTQGSFVVKPMNQFLLQYGAYLKMSDQSNGIYIPATIRPKQVYHEVGTLESGWEGKRAGTWVSLMREHPNADDMTLTQNPTGGEWTTQKFQDAWAASVGGHYEFLQASVLHTEGGNAPDQGAYASGIGSLFEERYPYQNALLVGATFNPIRKTALATHVLMDFNHEGALWSTEFCYRPQSQWAYMLGADLLGALNSTQNNFFSRYQGNSSVHGGVSYVF